MQLSISTQPLQLVRRQFVSFRHARGMHIRCESGLLWITVGDTRDILLEAGESFNVDGDDLVMINAIQASQLSLQPLRPAQAAPQRGMRAWLFRRASRLLADAVASPSIAPLRRHIRE